MEKEGKLARPVLSWPTRHRAGYDLRNQRQVEPDFSLSEKHVPKLPLIAPVCYLHQFPLFQSWQGLIPLQNYIYPLRQCELFGRNITCPHEAIDVLQKMNGGEYHSGSWCLGVPFLAGRNMTRDDRMKDWVGGGVNETDLHILRDKSKELHDRGLGSFWELYGGGEGGLPAGWSSADDPTSKKTYYYNAASVVSQWDKPQGGSGEYTCEGIPFSELVKRGRNTQEKCPPTKNSQGLEDYEDTQ